jgi:hypothetical protein
LLLLRSEESTLLGVRWLDRGIFAAEWLGNPERRAARWLRIGAAIGIVVGLGLGFPAAKLYLVGHDGWSAFGRGVGLSLTILWLAVAVAVAGVIAAAGANAVAATMEATREEEPEGPSGIFMQIANWVFRAIAAAAALSVALVAAAAAAVGIAIAGAGAGAIAIAIAGAIAVPVAVAIEMLGAATLAGKVSFLTIVPGILLGLWLSTLIFRFAATARYAREGYRRLPTNVQRLALCMTPLQQPDLLPGLPAEHALRFNLFLGVLFSRFGASDEAIDRFKYVAISVFAFIIYVPAWAYRFVLKSTLWFWWILLVIGGAPRVDGGIEGLRADAYRKAWPWVGIATALFSLAMFSANWLAAPLAKNFVVGPKLPLAVALLVLVKWKSIPVVTYITVGSVLTTFAVGFWTQAVYTDSHNPLRAARVDAQLPWLGHLVKWKSGFGAIGIVLLMLYFILYANAIHHYLPVSNWAAGWLRWLYGMAADRLLLV